MDSETESLLNKRMFVYAAWKFVWVILVIIWLGWGRDEGINHYTIPYIFFSGFMYLEGLLLRINQV